MLFKRTRVYDVYINPKLKYPLEDIKYVQQGFSIYAFAFGAFWALFNRLWLLAGVLFIVQSVLFYLLTSGTIAQLEMMFVNYGIMGLLGFEASALMQYRVERDGYELYDVVIGADAIDAERRFLDRNLDDLTTALSAVA